MDIKFKNYLIRELRKVWIKWPARYQAIKAIRVDRGVYKCPKCLNLCKAKELNVDHIEPIIATNAGFIDWNTFIERLFSPVENHQAICKPCHKLKNKIESEERKLARQKIKKKLSRKKI